MRLAIFVCVTSGEEETQKKFGEKDFGPQTGLRWCL